MLRPHVTMQDARSGRGLNREKRSYKRTQFGVSLSRTAQGTFVFCGALCDSYEVKGLVCFL